MAGSLSFNAFLPPNTPETPSIAAPLGVCRCRESILMFQLLRAARLAYPTIARGLRRVRRKSRDGKWGPAIFVENICLFGEFYFKPIPQPIPYDQFSEDGLTLLAQNPPARDQLRRLYHPQ